jgi:5S rRNA maturation endonuclease (ribonuclease M5)
MNYDIERVSKKLIESLDKLFTELDIPFTNNVNHFSFACPIHSGDNPNGSSIMKRGVGNWQCFTEHCHTKYGTSNGGSLIQFIQAVLSTRYNREYSFGAALEWAAKFVGENTSAFVTPTAEESTRTNFIQLCKYINRKKTSLPVFTPRELVRGFLQIPSIYYIKRGYTEQVLHKFDIGYCFNTKKPFYDRIVTPFYDELGEFMIGCSGRNKHEQCAKCRMYHQAEVRCPLDKEEKLRATKWKHSTNFAADSYLYNYWNANKVVLRSRTVILVEGSGDVWRLEEAGIYNSLGLLGAKLSTNQQIILEQSGAINILIATDNDDAGDKAAASIARQCANLFNIKRISFPTKDPGSLSVEQVKRIFVPVLEKL